MAEKLYPNVPGDSHLPQEIIVTGNGDWRLTEIGLLEVISRLGKPVLRVADNTPEGKFTEFPADALISNVFDVARGKTIRFVQNAGDAQIQERLNTFHELVANIRAEWDGVHVNVWQEPLLKLLKQLGYNWHEIKSAILKQFPPGDPDTSADLRLVFNRAAGYVWQTNPDKVKIYSDV